MPQIPSSDAPDERNRNGDRADDDMTDGGGGDDPAPGARPRPRIARSAGGQVLAAAMLGLRDAIEGPKDHTVAIVVDSPGEPHDPDADFDLELDFDHPERSRVVMRAPTRAPTPPQVAAPEVPPAS